MADNGTDMYISGTWDERWDNDVLNPAFDALTASDFEVVAARLAAAARARRSPWTRDAGAASNQNGILEPGEIGRRRAVLGEPGDAPPAALAGVASGFGGPGRRDLHDRRRRRLLRLAGRGRARRAAATRAATAIALSVSNPGDAPRGALGRGFTETVNGAAAKTWTLHVGESFADVPPSNAFYAAIETLFHNGVTAGCGPATLLPGRLRHARADGGLPPEGEARAARTRRRRRPGRVFADVPAGAFALGWIEDLADSGITAGCGTGLFCPDAAVTRAQMAVFLLKARHGSAYAPPPAVGVFDDVPAVEPVRAVDRAARGRGHHRRLRRRQLLPGRSEHARTDGGVPDDDVRAEALRAVGVGSRRVERVEMLKRRRSTASALRL